jgi:hypothetical protein
MAFRTIRLHTCFRQDLGEPYRPDRCRCRKLISTTTALALIDEGTAAWRVDWTNMIACPAPDCRPVVIVCSSCGGTGRNPKNPRVPCRSCSKELFRLNPCARCGGSGEVPAQTWDLVRSVRAHKTPRVMTIEKANIERWLFDGNEEEGLRIEAWDELTQEIRFEILRTYWPEPDDPFRGLPVLPAIGGDQRTTLGKTVNTRSEEK